MRSPLLKWMALLWVVLDAGGTGSARAADPQAVAQVGGAVVVNPPPPKPEGRARVVATPQGAQVIFDGVNLGVSPVVLPPAAPGPHTLEVKAPGHAPHKQLVQYDGGEARVFTIDLKAAPADLGPAPPPPNLVREQTAFGGRTLHRGTYTADAGLGYPYLLDLKLTAGAWDRGMGGLDGGIEVRTFGSFTDVLVHGRLQFFADGPLYLAAVADFGGGGGPNGRNTLFGDVGAAMTLAFGTLVSFSARTWINFYTDRFCPSRSDRDTPRDDCMKTVAVNDVIYDPRGERESGARIYMGAWLDVPVWQHVSIFGGIYGAPFQKQRIMFRGDFNPTLADSDPNIYGQLGVTVKH